LDADNSTIVFRKDYTPPPFWIDSVDLEFDLEPNATVVKAHLRLRRNDASTSRRLTLDGEQLELKSIGVDGQALSDDQYRIKDNQLMIDELPDQCTLVTEVIIDPAANHALSGLYQSSGNFCTQCEAMGFRRITYFLDRPDVMATYRVTLRADRQRYPVLLSNGNRVSASERGDGRHEAVWEDPHPKPSYLFALVAGDLKCKSGSFVTSSGREVALEIWVEPQNIELCEHALTSLAKSMEWDEQKFGLEYDLDTYMIVAVNDFNMGAMENKGLNIFNSKFVLASPETATDDDYERIEAVIAHEYFHNWTGNRVTCRDWFQLTLKEGLTVFRDQQFTADQTSAAVKRIDDVALLRSRQFAEDSGPMAHPIRPESYVSMDNFYTSTVYNKGAEIIRMYHTRLGEAGFRRGMDLYFQRHDGSAATCDDFRDAMTDAGDEDFGSMERWYAQAGTPDLFVQGEHDPQAKTYTLTLSQSYPELSGDIPGAQDRVPVPIPVAVGLIDDDGKDIPLTSPDCSVSGLLLLDQESQSFQFTGVDRPVVPSVLRNFSAPVRLHLQRSDTELAFLMANDNDHFNRWDASQQLVTRVALQLCSQDPADDLIATYVQSFGAVLSNNDLDDAFKALMLTPPSESVIGQSMSVVDPEAIHKALQTIRYQAAKAHKTELLNLYRELSDGQPYALSQQAIRLRRLKNVVLNYLARLNHEESSSMVVAQFHQADNMTDKQAALAILADSDISEREAALDAFHEQWESDPLVLDKWFTVQAASTRNDTADHVRALSHHKDFSLTNPNRVRSLIGVFAANQARFHQDDGSGYRFLADHVLKIDQNNPQLAARLVSAFNSYRRFSVSRQERVRNELSRIAEHKELSKDVREIVERALKF
tara:strand:- start:43944 stop:46574 length:2631 start_codon:yes stop_codon:yes gene_type:complete